MPIGLVELISFRGPTWAENSNLQASEALPAVDLIDLTTQPVTKLETILFQPLTGTGNNQPDAMGGGVVIVDGALAISLRAAGQVAPVDAVGC